jgi:hypothetical protein
MPFYARRHFIFAFHFRDYFISLRHYATLMMPFPIISPFQIISMFHCRHTPLICRRPLMPLLPFYAAISHATLSIDSPLFRHAIISPPLRLFSPAIIDVSPLLLLRH